MKTMTASSVRANFAATLAHVAESHETVIIHRSNGQSVMIVPLVDSPELDTTAYLMSSPANRERLLQGLQDIKDGNYDERSLIY